MPRSSFLILTLGLVAGPVLAQAPELSIPRSLTLQDAIELAYQNNPLLRQVANNLNPATWGVRNAYASFVPSLSISGRAGYSGAGTQNFLTTDFVQSSGTVGSSYNVGLNLNISGRTLMQPGVARANFAAAEASITGAEINLESVIRGQYLAVKEAEAQLDLSRLQLTRNEEFLRLAQARFEVGQNTLLDVRRAEVERGQSQVQVLRAQQGVVVEKLRMFQTIGIRAPNDPNVVTFPDVFPVVEPQWQLQALLDEAEVENPDLIVLRAQESSANASERATRSDYLPSLSLSAGWSGFTQQFTNTDFVLGSAEAQADGAVAQCQFTNANWQNPGTTPQDCSQFAWDPAFAQPIIDRNSVFPFSFTAQPFSASIGISLPIFTQFSRPLQVAQASAQTEDAAEAVRARELLVRTAVSENYYALQAAYTAIGIQESNRTAAQEGLRLATERYRVGSGTFYELLDAQLAAQLAEADYVNAVYAYHRAIATLENAVGRPLR